MLLHHEKASQTAQLIGFEGYPYPQGLSSQFVEQTETCRAIIRISGPGSAANRQPTSAPDSFFYGDSQDQSCHKIVNNT